MAASATAADQNVEWGIGRKILAPTGGGALERIPNPLLLATMHSGSAMVVGA